MTKAVTLTPIGVVHSTRKGPVDDDWDKERMTIELDARYPAEALAGLEAFSHAEIVFLMNQVPDDKIETAARRPRNNPDWPRIGIFAQRGKNRPNRIGLTVVSVLKVEGRTLHVKGLDAVDETPVLDIKPWVVEFGPRGTVKQPEWITELMREYWES